MNYVRMQELHEDRRNYFCGSGHFVPASGFEGLELLGHKLVYCLVCGGWNWAPSIKQMP